MAIRNVALVDCTTRIDFKLINKVANAISRQVANELAEEWGHTGAVIAIGQDDPLPAGYSAVNLYDKLDERGLGGIHYYTDRGEAYANVSTSIPHWSLATSHEVLEIICDPTTDWKIEAPSINDPNEMVEYLVEVSDPCQHYNYSYDIDGVVVSDFYLRNYFDASGPKPGVYSYNEKLTRPLQILPGGYLSWRKLSGQWYRGTSNDSGKRVISPIPGFIDLPGDSIRERMDFHSSKLTNTGYFCDTGPKGRKLTKMRDAELAAQKAHTKKAAAYRKAERERHMEEIRRRLKEHAEKS